MGWVSLTRFIALFLLLSTYFQSAISITRKNASTLVEMFCLVYLITTMINVWFNYSRWNAQSTKNEKKHFSIKRCNNISIISGRCLAFPYLIFSKASVYNRLISPHCPRLTTTVSFSLRDHLSPSSSYSQYFMKSGDTFVYWVSSKSAFLTLYISQLSFLRSTSLPPLRCSLFSTYRRCLSRSAFIARDTRSERRLYWKVALPRLK